MSIQPKEMRKRKIVDPSRSAPYSSVERNFSKFSGKKRGHFLFFGQSCWNCRFKLPRSRAFQRRVTCPSAAKKVAVPTCLGLAQARLIRPPKCRNYWKPYFFVWGPILVKFHIRTRLNKSFAMTYRFWKCSQEKLHFTPVHILHQLKHDEVLFPPLRRVGEFRARYS